MSTWKKTPTTFGDSEIIRFTLSDPDSTPLERNLALRIDRLLYKCDDLEMDVANAEAVGSVSWEQLELFPKTPS